MLELHDKERFSLQCRHGEPDDGESGVMSQRGAARVALDAQRLQLDKFRLQRRDGQMDIAG